VTLDIILLFKLKILFEIGNIYCCFSSVNLLNFLPKINRCWTTFVTLAEIERDCKDWYFPSTTGESSEETVVHVVIIELNKQTFKDGKICLSVNL